MIAKKLGSVTIPQTLRTLGMVFSWARQVNLAIQQLRDQSIVYHVTRGGSGGKVAAIVEYIPWDPQFFTTGSPGSLVYKCRFNLGTVNGVCAENWSTEHTLPSDGEARFVILDISASSGEITSLTISLAATNPIVDNVTKDTPPSTWKVLLGVVDRSNGDMIIVRNLNALGSEVFRESKTVTGIGSEPFSRWWRWAMTSV